jgi:hypothetical protein
MNSSGTSTSIPSSSTANPSARRVKASRLLTRHGFLALLSVLAIPIGGLAASKPRRRSNKASRKKRPRRSSQRQNANARKAAPPTAPESPPDPRKPFRDLPVGTTFYHASDADRRLFPLRKVSATHAQAVQSGGSVAAEFIAVPGEMRVIPQ